jgi:hypothetical protein
MELSSPERIRHIPFILYHWRAVSGSTALALDEKNYPQEAARRAVQEHFARAGIRADVSKTEDGAYNRITYPYPPRPHWTVWYILPPARRNTSLGVISSSIN